MRSSLELAKKHVAMKISRVAFITSVALFALAACSGSESSIQSSSSSEAKVKNAALRTTTTAKATLPPKGAWSGDATGEKPCWLGYLLDCDVKSVGPGGGMVFSWVGNQSFIEVSKQTLPPDKLCDSDTPRKEYALWPGYDGLGNNAVATDDLYSVCSNGLAGKAYGHSQTSPIYQEDYARNLGRGNSSPEDGKGWRLPTLEEAKKIYELRPVTGNEICLNTFTPIDPKLVCEVFPIEDGWYYTVTPNLESGKCGYWAINMADGQTRSVKPNEQLRGLMVRNFGQMRENSSPRPPAPVPDRAVLESYTPTFLKKFYDTQFKGSKAIPATRDGIIEALLKLPGATKKASCPVPATTTTVAPAPATTTTTTTTVAPPTTVAPTTTVKTAAPPTTVKKVSPPTTVKKIVKKK